MDFHALLGLVLATVVLGLVPGPVVAALVGRALWGGMPATFGLLAGVFIGDLIWLLAAVSGLAYLAASYSSVFLIIKYVGALYLVYLGGQALYQACGNTQKIPLAVSSRKGAGFVSGLLVTLGNPKLAAFYVGFLPTFINMQALGFQETVWAAILVPSTFLLVNTGWAACAAKARSLFKQATPLRILNAASGSLLAGSGAYLMAKD